MERVFVMLACLLAGVCPVQARPVLDVRRTRRLDLLPSSLDLIEVQDRLVTMPAGPGWFACD